jgi:hypothetical protein
MRTRHRGGGNQKQKVSPTGIHPPRIQSPSPAAANSDLPETDGIAERHAALPGSATPAGAPRHPITQLPAKTNAVVQCSILRARLESNPAPITDPPRATAAADQDAGKGSVRDSGPGAHEPLVSHPSCISVQHPRARAIFRPIPESCTTVQHKAAKSIVHRPAALVHAEQRQGGSAAPRRLEGHPSSNKTI